MSTNRPGVVIICDDCQEMARTQRPTPAGAREIARQAGWLTSQLGPEGRAGESNDHRAPDICPDCIPRLLKT